MANNLIIERVANTRFEFQLNGGDIYSDAFPTMFTKNGFCDFKTRNGANIIKKQKIHFSEIIIKDTFGATADYVADNIANLWEKLRSIKFFNGYTTILATEGATRFDGLEDTFAYFGNNGKVPVVNESQSKMIATPFYNFDKLIQLSDVAISSLIEGKVLGVQTISGVPKVVLVNPTTGSQLSNSTRVEKIPIIAEAGDTYFILPSKPLSIDLYREGQWQINLLDFTYDSNTGKITPDPSITINENDFFEVVAYYIDINKTPVYATVDNQYDYNFAGIASTVNVILKGSWLIEGTDYTRTYYSTNNKITIINTYLLDNISIGDLVEIITF